METDWIAQVRRDLLRFRGGSAGWGYRPGTEPFVEPTVLAGLGLLATGDLRSAGAATGPVMSAADWLAAAQQPDGSVGIAAHLPAPRWPTALALLLWSALGDYQVSRGRAVHWLLEYQGQPYAKSADSPVGHDTQLVGWPWTDQTHSWVEPTAIAILALAREGKSGSERVHAGIRLIQNRAIVTGGWNYGNNVVFETDLRAQPAPTGMALLALASVGEPHASVPAALDYLHKTLPAIRTARSLCWGLLGVSAWTQRPSAAGAWLRECFQKSGRRGNPSYELALLLFAAGGTVSLGLLGLPGPTHGSG